MARKGTLLITGAAGLVGRGLRPYLAAHYKLILFDRQPIADTGDGAAILHGDMVDAKAVGRAVDGCDHVLHLAAIHGLTVSFEETLEVNYRGTVHLMEAAVRKRIEAVVFASSNHCFGFHKVQDAPLADTAPVRPDGWYAINKVWGEAVMAFYADAHGLTTTSLRIGNANENVIDERRLHMWISFRDLAALIRASLARRDGTHRAVFATADCASPYFDNAGARALGFASQDRPEDHLADGFDAQAAPQEFIGGEFALANCHRGRNEP